MVWFSLYRVTYGPTVHAYRTFYTWVERRHSLSVREQVINGIPRLYFDVLWSLGNFDAVKLVLLHVLACVELLVCGKVHGEHFGAPPLD